MKTGLIPTVTAKFLIGIIAVFILSTIGCSSSVNNPVSGGIGEDLPDTGSQDSIRESQFQWENVDEHDLMVDPLNYSALIIHSNQFVHGNVSDANDQDDYFRISTDKVIDVYAKLGWTGGGWLNIYLYDENWIVQLILLFQAI
ncbi:MAG TPA: hypothetical protein VGB30_07255 [bacterium]|jgi:hypothetical protein